MSTPDPVDNAYMNNAHVTALVIAMALAVLLGIAGAIAEHLDNK